MLPENILSLLPYDEPFRFVDDLEAVDEDGVIGSYTYPEDSYFYRGHFKNYPVTPGVILTETMAQIGLICLGIYLSREQLQQIGSEDSQLRIAMTSSEVDYLKPVYPGETVKVISKKIYFRFGKLKCNIEMQNRTSEVVCKGTLAGMMLR